MDAERFRSLALALPQVEETRQWGDNLVYWVGDKAIGGKMFALLNLDEAGRHSRHKLVLSLSVGAERYHELLEQEGVAPAPYLARAFWVALERWDALPARELRSLLEHARELTYEKLPKRVKAALALTPAEYREAISKQRALRESQEKKKAKQTVRK